MRFPRIQQKAVPQELLAGPEAVALGSSNVVGNSLAGSLWTVVSRITGLGRALTIGAVLGATYLGNTYQAINSVPNLIYFLVLAGSLFTSILVPPLVQSAERGDLEGARRLAKGFFGCALVAAFIFAALLIAIGRPAMRLFTIGVTNRSIAAAEDRVGWILLIMFVPQIVLYAIAGIGAAVMNARGRFALAAAAPAFENVGMIGALVAAAAIFGVGVDILHVSNAELVLLGLGTTAAVGVHAGFEWWGARWSGVTLIPSRGWRDPEVRAVLRRIFPVLLYTGMEAAQVVVILIVANRVQGGNVAFQLALNFSFLPVAVVTWPVARALLPQLSRLRGADDGQQFRDELVRGVALASFLAIPIGVAYLALGRPLARAAAFGQLGTAEGVRLVSLSLTALGVMVVGETWFILGTYAFYAREDVRTPLRSMAVRLSVSSALMIGAWPAHGAQILPSLGVALSVGSLAGAWDIARRLRSTLPHTGDSLLRPLARTGAASLLMIVPAFLTAWLLDRGAHSEVPEIVAMMAAAFVGAVTYLIVQRAWRAPELTLLKQELPRTRRDKTGRR